MQAAIPMDKSNTPSSSDNQQGVEEEKQPLVHSTAIHSARYLPSVSKTYHITWTIEKIDLIDEQVLRTEKFPDNENCDRFFVQLLKDRVGNRLIFSFFKCSERVKKMEGVAVLLEYRPVVMFFNDDEEVEGKFNDDSEVVVELTEEWRERFIKEGGLRVGCSVREPSPEVDLKLGPLSEIMSEKHVLTDLWNLWESKTYTDVQVIINDGRMYSAHKMVLSARSSVFKELLLSPEASAVELPYDTDTTWALLYFIYTGRCESKHLRYSMMEAADKYNLRDLKLRVEHHLAEAINHENVFDTLIHAISHNACHLHQACVTYIKSNHLTQTIIQSKEWKDLDDILKLDLATRLFSL